MIKRTPYMWIKLFRIPKTPSWAINYWKASISFGEANILRLQHTMTSLLSDFHWSCFSFNLTFCMIGSRHSSQSGSLDPKPYRNTSQSLPRTSSSTPSGAPSSSSTLQRSSSSSGRSSSKSTLWIQNVIYKSASLNIYSLNS